MSTGASTATKRFLTVRIASSTAFILWLCGGARCITVRFFCNIHFKAEDASFSIMFNFGTCPAFSNVLYETYYAHNIYVSLLVLVGSTKITIV